MKNPRSFLIALFLLVFHCFGGSAQGPDVVIPVPTEYSVTEGTYVFEDEPEVRIVRVKGMEPEGYCMKVTRKGILIKSSDDAGEFYAAQTLRQMTSGGKVKEIKCCEISDSPRFPYRGLHFQTFPEH